MNRDKLKRIIALLLLGALVLGFIPLAALGAEDVRIKQTLYKEGVGIRVAMSAPIDPNELSATGTATAEPISAMVLVKSAEVEAEPEPTKYDSEEEAMDAIGGADGPTAILVSGNIGGLVAILAAVICSGVAIIVALKKRKK